MAEIVTGLASSHSPQLSIAPELWSDLGELDRRNPTVPYDRLLAQNQDRLAQAVTLEQWQAKYQACQDAIARLGRHLTEAAVDAVVVVGDDQGELWGPEGQPALAIFSGEVIWDIPIPPEQVAPAYRPGLWAWHNQAPDPYPALPALARHLVAHLSRLDFDVTQFSQQLPGRPLSHSFTFVRRRLGLPSHIPILPVVVNAHVSPNQPSPQRCWQLGQALRSGIRSWPEAKRIALVATGGLTHWGIDEGLDHQVLDAILQGRPESLRSLDPSLLAAGTSELRAWITIASALADYSPQLVDYVPAYRSLAGTGVGMGFMVWQPA
ncbi:MAG: hypothetical protein K6U87_13205 [Firmicutes bacterium]|nr:hypothetical protein [Bacillota bacterium]